MICTQETRLHCNKYSLLPNFFWRGATFFGCEAHVAYNNESRGDGAGSGKIGMCISSNIFHLIDSHGESREGNYQWVKLSELPWGDLAI